MADDPRQTEGRGLSPEEAFATLADNTRLQTLRVLGEADMPLSFSELFERVDYDRTANFSYHLEKLDGHFVRRTDDGYVLRQAGRRVVEAILSGAVTDDPVMERTEIDMDCPRCGTSMEISYFQESLGIYCSKCGGTRDSTSATAEWAIGPTADVVGHVTLPPAGVYDRTSFQLLHAAEVWTVTEAHAIARGVCPRCSAPVEHAVRVCEDHDASDGRCDVCDQEFGVTIHVECTNCILEETSIFTKYLLSDPDLMAFMIDHGIDPLAPEGFHVTAFDETILSTTPFRAEFTFTADDEAIILTVDDDLTVISATQSKATGSS